MHDGGCLPRVVGPHTASAGRPPGRPKQPSDGLHPRLLKWRMRDGEGCSIRPFTPQHHWKRAAQEAQIVPEGPVRDVDVVEPDHLLKRGSRYDRAPARAPSYPDEARAALPPSPRPGHPRAGIRGRGPTRLISPTQNVDELRQLIKGRAPENPSEPGHARVLGNLEHPDRSVSCVLVQMRKRRLSFIRVAVHRAELEDLELATRRHQSGPGGRTPGRGVSELDQARDDEQTLD